MSRPDLLCRIGNKPNSRPVIVTAEIADIPAITKICAYAVINGRASFELQPPDETEIQRRYKELVDGAYPYLVAKIDNILAGYAYAGPYRSRPGYRWSVENSVYINPEFQGLGLGSLLLDRIIQICTEKNFRQMIAIIADSANTSSIRLHEKAGFTHIAILVGVGRKHDTWIDSVIMQKQLGAGSSEPPDSALPLYS